MTIATLTEHCGHQINEKGYDVWPIEGESWAETDGIEPPFNTLVFADEVLSTNALENLYRSVSI